MTRNEMANKVRGVFKPKVMEESLSELELLLKEHLSNIPVTDKVDDNETYSHLYDPTYKEYVHWMDAYKHLTFLIEGCRTARRHTYTLVVSWLALIISICLLITRLLELK